MNCLTLSQQQLLSFCSPVPYGGISYCTDCSQKGPGQGRCLGNVLAMQRWWWRGVKCALYAAGRAEWGPAGTRHRVPCSQDPKLWRFAHIHAKRLSADVSLWGLEEIPSKKRGILLKAPMVCHCLSPYGLLTDSESGFGSD